MSSEWNGRFYKEDVSDDGIAECIGDLFYEPPGYDELCFYCVEGTNHRCSSH